MGHGQSRGQEEHPPGNTGPDCAAARRNGTQPASSHGVRSRRMVSAAGVSEVHSGGSAARS